MDRQLRAPEDLAVAYFLAGHSGRSPEFVMVLRREGASWWEIGEGFGVDPAAWFLRDAETTPPPFAEMHERWRDATLTGDRLTLADEDCRRLVAARFLHDYFVITAGTAMEWCVSGRDLEQLTADEYRARHVQGRGNRQDTDRAALMMESSMFGSGLHPAWD